MCIRDSILAATPAGPSWFVVEKDTPGFSSAPPEDKHGLRLSNTAALYLCLLYTSRCV